MDKKQEIMLDFFKSVKEVCKDADSFDWDKMEPKEKEEALLVGQKMLDLGWKKE